MHLIRQHTFLGIALLALGAFVNLAAAQSVNPHSAMEGVWQVAQPRSSLRTATDPQIPFTRVGRQQYERNKAAAARGDYAFDRTMLRCSSPGAPRIMLTQRPFKLFVRDDIIYMMFEWNRLLRQVDMRGTVTDDAWGTVMGSASGRWEADTLVIESRGFVRDRLLDDLLPNSEQLRLLERIRLLDANTLEDRITITDPEMFTRSWEARVVYARQPVQTFPEDVCLDRKAAGQSPWPRR